MKKIQRTMAAAILMAIAVPSLFCRVYAQSNVIPIQNGNQLLNNNANNGDQTVDAIVTDSNGNMTEQQLPYNPANQTVIINNNYGGDDASIFFPIFSLGFMFWAGYWVGHDGYYWNGGHYVHVTNVNWNQHWNNYWRHTWAPKWNHYYNQHHTNSNFKWQNHQKDWHDNAGNWHNQGFRGNMNRGGMNEEGGMRGGGGERMERGGGGGRAGGGGGGGGHR